MKYVFNCIVFTLFYFVVLFLFIYFDKIDISILNSYLGENFFKNDIKNIALANIGIFASLTGFLIASMPFLVGIIIKEDYLISAVKNNLNEIIIALKTILILFILSLFILFINIEQYHFYIKIGIVSTLIYLYIILLYNIYEIVGILNVFLGDLKKLKNNLNKSSKD